MITAQVENLTEHLDELKALFPLHWEELALNREKVPLDPMYEVYLQRDAHGECLLVTLRENGKLLGYFVGFIAPGLHYRTCLTLTMDIFYVHPQQRCRFGGLKLFRTVEKEARRRGVQRMFVGSKCHADVGRLFEALKYTEVERYYSVWLGD